jgi:hypothetical protein
MNGTPLLDYAASRIARDEALARVTRSSDAFMVNALIAISQLRGEFRGEQIRATLMAQGIEPHHHNAWGAVVRSALKRGLLEATGRFEAMHDVKSHARKTEVYLAVGAR